MTAITWALALAAPLGEQAHARTQAYGPHVAHYLKESTQDPTLEIHYRGPTEATARAMSPDGVFVVSVDATHMRLRIDETTCASVAAVRLLDEATALAMGQPLDDLGPQRPRLIYRADAKGMVDLSTAFLPMSTPVLFSWHSGLDEEGVVVTTEKSTWVAQAGPSSWTVDRKTGLLQRLVVGDDALVLGHVDQGKKATPMPALQACPETSSAELAAQVETQIRLVAFAAPWGAVAAAWNGLDADARADALERHQAWWTQFFASELPLWTAGWSEGPWREQVVQDMSDRAAFEAFRAQLPEEDQPQAVVAWKRAWFDDVAQNFLWSHLDEVATTAAGTLTEMGAPTDEAVRQTLLLEPMQAAMLASAEGVIQGPIVPVIEQGGAALERALVP